MKSRTLWSAVLVAAFVTLPSVAIAQQITDQERQQLADQRIKSGLKIDEMKKNALLNDPKVQVAKENLDKAKKDWSALQAQVDEALKSDPDYQKAEEALKAAEDKTKAAQKSLADASAQQRKAQEQADKQKSQSRQNYSGGGGGGAGYQQQTYVKQEPKPNPLASQIKAVHDAKDEENKIRISMNQIKGKVQKSLESKDDWKAAKAAVDKAQAEYDAACKPVLAALKDKPEYAALLKQEADAQAKLDLANGR